MVRFGILGTANIARKQLIPAMRLAAGCEPFAVASRDTAKGEAFARECGVARIHGSYEALLADPEVDAVYIPLPTGLHAQWCLKCAEAGKPVLCEKPLATSAAEARRIATAFQARGLLLSEGYMYRFHPLHQKVRELVADGAIGALRAVHATFHVDLPETDIRYSAKLGGGALLDLGCYCVGIARLIAGCEPASCAASARFRGGVDVAIGGSMVLDNGVLATFSCSLDTAFDCHYAVHGTKGRISVARGGMVAWPGEAFSIRLWRDGREPEDIMTPAANSYQLMLEAFARALRVGGQPPVSNAESIANLAALDQLLQSARQSAAVAG